MSDRSSTTEPHRIRNEISHPQWDEVSGVRVFGSVAPRFCYPGAQSHADGELLGPNVRLCVSLLMVSIARVYLLARSSPGARGPCRCEATVSGHGSHVWGCCSYPVVHRVRPDAPAAPGAPSLVEGKNGGCR